MSLARVLEQTQRHSLVDTLMYEISIAGFKIILNENPLMFVNKATDFSPNPAYPPGRIGHAYRAAQEGEVGQNGGVVGTGKYLNVDDILLCIEKNDGGDEATVGSSWMVIRASGSTATSLSQIDQSPLTTGMTYGFISGLVDGVNRTFTVSKKNYIPGKLVVVYRGMIMFMGIDFEELDAATGQYRFLYDIIADSSLLAIYAYKAADLGSYDDSFDDSFDG